MSKFRVILVEDHMMLREMLRLILDQERNIQVVAECSRGGEATAACREHAPDLVILDLMLPDMPGLDVLRTVRAEVPNCRALIVSGQATPELVADSLRMGAHGFVEKGASIETLQTAIRTILNGATFFSPAIHAILKRTATAPPPSVSNLTDRELEILRLVAQGLLNKEIADRLGVSIKTVDNHRTNLMRKLNVHDAVGVTLYAIKAGLVSPS
jgi:DNA-binding NarL/FixJ family response regulator